VSVSNIEVNRPLRAKHVFEVHASRPQCRLPAPPTGVGSYTHLTDGLNYFEQASGQFDRACKRR
jgi:hypothetical protein